MKREFTLIASVGFLLFSGSAQAMGPTRMKPEDKAACDKIAKTSFKEYKQADLGKFQPANPDTVKLPYQMPVSLVVYNHQGMMSKIDEDELSFHIQQARAAYQPCGIEVIVDSVRYLEGPKVVNNLERSHPDKPKTLSDQERCLFTPVHKTGIVNVYFAEEAHNDHGDDAPHAFTKRAFMSTGEYAHEKSRRFTGAAIITDAVRYNNPKGREVVMAHELGHIVMDLSHSMDGKPDLMSDNLSLTFLGLSNTQCSLARSSPFVTLRASPDNFEAEAATRCDRNCPLELHEWGNRQSDVCSGFENEQLKKIAFCDAEEKIVNPFAIAGAPRKGTAACRYYFLKRASLEAKKSKMHSQETVAEGSGLFVYQDCRVVKKGPQEELFAAMGETVYDYTADSKKYCELMQQ